jgi:5-formyltetrahydrofolate cyclo-ligase
MTSQRGFWCDFTNPPMSESNEIKRALRAEAAAARRQAHAAGGAAAARQMRDLFLAEIPLPAEAIVSGYWPLGEELDDRPLLETLNARGHLCVLPVVARRSAPLIFRQWRPGDAMQAGEFAILVPSAEAPAVEPDALIVPLLAFDAGGHRLGYGGGYFDRTLKALRARKKILAVGVAFAVQEMPHLPRGPEDEPLDWIVTELAARRIEKP